MSVRERAESYWRAEQRRDIEEVLAHYHEDAVFCPPGERLEGHDQIRTFYESSAADYPTLEVTITHEIAAGDDEASLEWEAVLVDHDGGRHPLKGVNNIKLEDGKFREVRAYFDPATLEQRL